MATSKKSTPKEAAKKIDKKKPPVKITTDFPNVYMRLRTVLDGLEIGALQYCLRDDNVKERIKRAEEIIELLIPVIDEIRDKTMLPTVCADGYYNCGGVCVPYQCPASK